MKFVGKVSNTYQSYFIVEMFLYESLRTNKVSLMRTLAIWQNLPKGTVQRRLQATTHGPITGARCPQSMVPQKISGMACFGQSPSQTMHQQDDWSLGQLWTNEPLVVFSSVEKLFCCTILSFLNNLLGRQSISYSLRQV